MTLHKRYFKKRLSKKMFQKQCFKKWHFKNDNFKNDNSKNDVSKKMFQKQHFKNNVSKKPFQIMTFFSFQVVTTSGKLSIVWSLMTTSIWLVKKKFELSKTFWENATMMKMELCAFQNFNRPWQNPQILFNFSKFTYNTTTD